MQSCKIRPHHALCTQFFRGEGYSSDFCRNMANIISILTGSDPTVCIVCGADAICAGCPNLHGGLCSDMEKVRRYDKKSMELCGLSEGQKIKWSELRTLAGQRIISSGQLSEVCGDCRWYYICGNGAL